MGEAAFLKEGQSLFQAGLRTHSGFPEYGAGRLLYNNPRPMEGVENWMLAVEDDGESRWPVAHLTSQEFDLSGISEGA